MRHIGRVVSAIGAIVRLFSPTFLVPAVIAFAYDARDIHLGDYVVARGVLVFIGCAAASYLLGTLLHWAGRSDVGDMTNRESYLAVGLGWLVLCLVAMVPFMLEGVLVHPVDAFFEAMSGLTTTGATVIPVDLDEVPKSLMIWRALLQFLGGMGIIVLSVAVLARLSQGGATMLQAESPGPSMQRVAPRIAYMARILWGVYAAFGAFLFAALFAVLSRHGMGVKQTVYEALLHTLTTISTGGFAAHSASIAYFDDWLLEAVIIFFMLVSATNYTLYVFVLRGQKVRLLRDPEWRFFIGTYLVATLAVSGLLVRAGTGALQALRESSFTVASLISSTGLTTGDFDLWPATAKLILILVMVTGATAGSTGGGLKHVRVLILFKMVQSRIVHMLHPRAVHVVQLGGRPIPQATLMATAAFFMVFVAIWAAVTVALLVIEPTLANPVDAASASISALSNMGPGLGAVGPTQNFAPLTHASKLILALESWFGRLEVFAALLVFTPETWRK